MRPSPSKVAQLAAKLSLGPGHEAQERAVATALHHLLTEGRRGVVLADEVGFGKTYEALALMTLLCEQARLTDTPFERVLVLCKSSLLGKWQEELSKARPDRGFPRYLQGETWSSHPIHGLLKAMRVISGRSSADELRRAGIRGQRDEGTIQAPRGIWVVKHDALSERSRTTRPLLSHLWRTRWDLIIIDEAHHCAHWNQPAYLFAPDGNMRNYDQGLALSQSGRILALTATPFELTPHELVTLLALVRADQGDLDLIERGLTLYVEQLDRFFNLRQRSPQDPLRRNAVERLRQLREEDALASGKSGPGLQALLRRYIIRNTKSQNERRYFLVNKIPSGYTQEQFDKLEDLHERVRQAPLLPFDGLDALFYLELRELVQETIDMAREGEGQRTFVTTDLRQGLSSYPQIARSTLLQRDIEPARRLRALVDQWNRPETLHLHPKVRSLVDITARIARQEVEKVRRNPQSWLSKVLVFNKLTAGTAGQLREELEKVLSPIFDEFLNEQLRNAGVGNRDSLAQRFRDTVRLRMSAMEQELNDWRGDFCLVPESFEHEAFREHRGRHLLDVYRERLVRKVNQTLLLLHATQEGGVETLTATEAWLDKQLLGPFKRALSHIIDHYLDDDPGEDPGESNLLEQAEREAVALLEEVQDVRLVGRYDGEHVRERESHRRNFNGYYNPFVLLVSRVGEEGIDLQQQCRYVIHYDLEWNPAKMEQREGRVDRIGWGRAEEGYIDVRFLLLKGTYEERIFHAVMQRDQWFQVLIGSKRKELGRLGGEEDEATEAEEHIEETHERGMLTPEEKRAVMIDLRPAEVPIQK